MSRQSFLLGLGMLGFGLMLGLGPEGRTEPPPGPGGSTEPPPGSGGSTEPPPGSGGSTEPPSGDTQSQESGSQQGGVEVQARGSVHEAFGQPTNTKPEPGP